MEPKHIIMGKKVLLVDDEPDVLDMLCELLILCKIDTAISFEEARKLISKYNYDIAVLDIMGVHGLELLKITSKRKIPTIMLTSHGLTQENLVDSVEMGAAYFVPKEEMKNIATYVADVIEARNKNKNPWIRWFERLGGYFDVVFTGPDWRQNKEKLMNRTMEEI